MLRKNLHSVIPLMVLCVCAHSLPAISQAAQFKVLVVMSYEEDFFWHQDIKKGIEEVLGDNTEFRYMYLDTKTNPAGGEQKAREAYAVYQKFQPDGIITSDDNAQSMFVVPYLKEKVNTPVVFCGVNADPKKYGYPASNVTGILERQHFAESIAFAQLLVPSIQTVGFIAKDDETGHANLQQLQDKSDTFSAHFTEFRMVKTQKEALMAAEELKPLCDALLFLSLAGITDGSGTSLTDKEIMPLVAEEFGKPCIGFSPYHVRYGLLSAVTVSGQEQGWLAAERLLKIMQGTPVTDIPIDRSYQGKRMLNAITLKALGIRPRADVLRGAELVITE